MRELSAAGLKGLPSPDDALKLEGVLGKIAYRELFLELFRQHPEIAPLKRVSRLCSFFAAESLEDAHRFAERLLLPAGTPIYEIHASGPSLCMDMNWIDFQFHGHYREFGYHFMQYWRGIRTDQDPQMVGLEARPPLVEVLLSGNVYVGPEVGKTRPR